MSIDFNPKRWETVKQNSRRWWAGELECPLIQATLTGRTPQRTKPDIPWHGFQSFYDFSVPVEKIVDWFEYNLESAVYLGDSFPHANPYFGPGELPHLDALLSIPELKGIQWIPGAGQPDYTQWPEVYRKIRAAGKLIQIYVGESPQGWKGLDILADQLGSAKGIVMIGGGTLQDEDQVNRVLERYGCAHD